MIPIPPNVVNPVVPNVYNYWNVSIIIITCILIIYFLLIKK
jgi:hypothetical protein